MINAYRDDPARVSQLDGLRGWAAFIVLLGHTLQVWMLNKLPLLGYPPAALVIDGTFAVQIFFVISGAALSIGPLTAASQRRAVIDLAAFRYFRLMIPATASCVIAYAIHRAGLFFNVDAGQVSGSAWLSSFYQFDGSFGDMLTFASYGQFFDYVPALSWNASLWTMHYELFGSFIVFGILLVNRTLFLSAALVAVAFIFSMTTIYGAFFLGMLIAVAHKLPWQVSKLAFAIFLFGVALYTTLRLNQIPPAGYFFMNLASAAIVFGVCFSAPLARVMTLPLSGFMGRISFSLYLIQLPLICSSSSWLYLQIEPHLPFTATVICVTAATVVSSIAIATVFDFFIERRLVRFAKTITLKTVHGIARSAPTPATSHIGP